MQLADIDRAWEELLNQLEALSRSVAQEGSGAFQRGEFELARQISERGLAVEEFRSKVRDLHSEWKRLAAFLLEVCMLAGNEGDQLSSRGPLPYWAFWRPILEALVELGGAAPRKKVLALVEQKMKDKFNEQDWEPLPSDPRTPRWRSRAVFCKRMMDPWDVESGAQGWVITDQGREKLARLQQEEDSSEAAASLNPQD